MIKKISLIGLSLVSLLISKSVSAQMPANGIVVYQVGDGAAALTNAGTKGILKVFDTSTANQTLPLDSFVVPTTGAARLVNSGNTSSAEGFITLSQDTSHIVLAGYDAATGTTNINNTAATATNRVVDTINALGNIGRAASTSTFFNQGSIRSVVEMNNNFWASGSNTGTVYLGNYAAPTAVQTVITSSRNQVIHNGSLFYSAAPFNGPNPAGIYKFSNLPNSSATSNILFATGNGSSPYNFVFNNNETIVYVADDRTTGQGGIQKWVNNAGTWTMVYKLSAGTNIGARGLAVDFSTNPSAPIVFATTTGNRLIKIADTGANSPFIVLATAPTNTAFRGITFTPKLPNWSCPHPNVVANAPTVFCEGDSVMLTSQVQNTYFNFQWYLDNTILPNQTNPSLVVHTTGSYHLVISDTVACVSSSDTLDIVAHALPIHAVSPSGNVGLCDGSTLTLATTNNATNSYQWYKDGVQMFGFNQSSFSTTTAGNYLLYVSDTNNCAAYSDTVFVTLNPLPTVTIAAILVGSNYKLITTAPFSAYQWYRNNQIIVDSTNQAITLTTPGAYYVIATDANGCKDTSNEVVVITSVDELAGNIGSVIYPNPAQNQFHIQMKQVESIAIFDIQGRPIKQEIVQNGKSIDISDLSNGLYWVKLFDKQNNALGIQKLIKN